MTPMHLQALRYLVAVVEEGHFGRAARRMHVSQPSVSQAVARLERQFGAQLLDRSGARVITTEAGERVVAEVRMLLRHSDLAFDVARSAAAQGPLRIACYPLLSMWLVIELISQFRKDHPQAEVTVAELDIPAQTRALLAHEIDLAVGFHLRPNERFRETTIREDPCAVWLSRDHPLADLEEVPLSALAGMPITDGDPDAHPFYRSWATSTLRSVGVEPTFAATNLDTPTSISRIVDGTMVGLACDILPVGAIPGLVVRRVSDPVTWPWVTTMLDDDPPQAALAFTSWARQRWDA